MMLKTVESKKNLSVVLVLSLLLLLSSCAYDPIIKTSTQDYKPSPNAREDKKIEAQSLAEPSWKFMALKTDDGKEIFGKYYKAEINATASDSGAIASNSNAVVPKSNVIVILLHMLDKDHSSWDTFAEQLYLENYSVIAVDLRGHGKSAENTGSWEEFSKEDFNNMVLDVKEAKEFALHEKKTRFVIIGASIGANLALNYAAKDNEVLGVALLSPGLDYRGVNIKNAILNYGQRPILLAASEDDKYSADTVNELTTKLFGKKKLVMFKDAGHGTEMLKWSELDKEIIAWLKEVISST